MSNKAIAEFEEYWKSLSVLEAFKPEALKAWLAATEKYAPRWIPVSERLPEIDQYVAWSCDDGYMIFAGRDKYDPDGYWKDRFTHWAVINLPSTQGGGE